MLDQYADGIKGKVAAVTGGGGVLCRAIALALAHHGVKVALLDIDLPAARCAAGGIQEEGGTAIAVHVNVLDPSSVGQAADEVISAFGRVDFLINGAGGNKREATTNDRVSFFDLPPDAIRWVCDLNFMGTLIPSQVFGQLICNQTNGCIVNIASMASIRPLTGTVAYSASKAAVANLTQWLAVYFSQSYPAARLRVNAIAPGFLLTEQNRYLLIDPETGRLTARAQSILDHTPLGRFGDPQELVSTLLWLLSAGASFVHGAVIPIDGGFSAYSGV